MKKTLIVLMMVLLSAMLIVSCDSNAKGVTRYKVTFETNGGSSVDAVEVEAGKSVTEPAEPTKEDWIFDKWTTDKDGKTAYDFSLEVKADITLYAQWRDYYIVGDTGPAGGIIFYVAASEQTTNYTDLNGASITLGWKYLEVAPGEVTVDGSTTLKWSSQDSGSYGTETGIGSGLSNTYKLLSSASDNLRFPASQACADYGNNTDYDDWFLPSKDELNEIYENRDALGTTFKTDDKYWSSSQYSSYYAWTQLYDNGGQYNSDFTTDYYVRPVRAFQ